MNIVGAIILLCWIILLGYWSIEAFHQKKVKEKQAIRSRIAYNLLLLVSYILLLFSSKIVFLKFIVIKTSPLIDFMALLLSLFGLVICLYSRYVLGSNWSRDITLKKNHELITIGPYKQIRHPIYLGLLSLFLGTTLAIGNFGSILGFLFLLINFSLKAKNEEELMIKHFKGEYLRYKKRTKALIPFFY